MRLQIDSADPNHQYMIRRSIDDGELAFYHWCDVRSHVLSDYVGGGSTDVVDVIRASVRARPYRDVRGRVLLGWV
jgi:hypothetical protein